MRGCNELYVVWLGYGKFDEACSMCGDNFGELGTFYAYMFGEHDILGLVSSANVTSGKHKEGTPMVARWD